MVTQKVKENGLQKETGSEEIKRTRSSKGKSEAPIAFYDHRQVNPRSLRAASSPFSASAGRTKQQRRSRLSPAAVAGKEEKQSARSSSSLAIIRSSGTLKRRGACMFCLRASACNRRQLACGVFRLPSHDDLTPPPPTRSHPLHAPPARTTQRHRIQPTATQRWQTRHRSHHPTSSGRGTPLWTSERGKRRMRRSNG